MFIKFFYLLREKGLKVSLNEWMTLIEALDKGLCGSSLLGFYYLCRAILVNSETDYDKFDMAFAIYFKDIESAEDIPEEVWKWLESGTRTKEQLMDRFDPTEGAKDLAELQKMLKERLEEQKARHTGGNYWVGTGGTSHLGHGGYNTQGMRVGGESRYKSALQVAQQREYKDFRQDNILDIRQFQMAFRKLRQFSSRIEAPRTELDVEKTVQDTCDNAGSLKLAWERPRKNTVKLLLLFDSVGSMTIYSRLCSALFRAVNKSNHFRDLKVYYFHNGIYDHLYTTPGCRKGEWIDTNWVLNNLGSDYRVIFVGDAAMAPSELLREGGNVVIGLYNEMPGIDWLNRFKSRYSHHIWLNPIPEKEWGEAYGSYTINLIKEIFPMYELTLDGLEAGIKKLLVNR